MECQPAKRRVTPAHVGGTRFNRTPAARHQTARRRDKHAVAISLTAAATRTQEGAAGPCMRAASQRPRGDARALQEGLRERGIAEHQALVLPLGPNDKLVFTGDLVDRGPQPQEAYWKTKELSDQNPGRVTRLLGNHEWITMMGVDKNGNHYLLWFTLIFVHSDFKNFCSL